MTNEVAAQADTVKGERLRHGPALREGIRDGIPIALGYLAVAFALGIAARNAGLTAFQGFVASFLNLASAGQYAGFTAIAARAVYWEVALITLVTNARYLLMSCALSQRFAPDTPLRHRLLVGYAVTDEIFGISIARPGYVEPWYNYGAMLVAVPGWSVGTALGVLAGNILPELVVTALSVALYGMFLAVIIPPARKSKVIAGVVAVSFALSFGAARLPVVRELSGGTRVILLTLLIAGAAAILFPVSEEDEEEEGAA
jgi:predicted branched-subunit amino acid permease